MPVQKSNYKYLGHHELATYPVKKFLHVPTTFYSLLCQKGQFTLQSYPRRWFFRKKFITAFEAIIEKFSCRDDHLSKKEFLYMPKILHDGSLHGVHSEMDLNGRFRGICSLNMGICGHMLN